ncbi:MAG: S-layer homology domain-containing protein [Lachnospiraceae bacterium]|nr:S-layer homology domain-containing protein [Lachnospiraceae bacterium]
MEYKKIVILLGLSVILGRSPLEVYGGEILAGDNRQDSQIAVTIMEDMVVDKYAPLLVSNLHKNNYTYYWAQVMDSYLVHHQDGSFTRIQYANGMVYIEEYDSDFMLVSGKTLQGELPRFGGFYNDGSHYYLVFGQDNPEEDDNQEVIRVIKYTHQWKRVGDAPVYGANTTVPFDAGSLRMVASGGALYIRTSHEMYQSDDGYNHQSCMTIKVDTEGMMVEDIAYEVQNSSAGYISHSFNQFIKVDEGNLITLDHGDAHPRSAVLSKYNGDRLGIWNSVTTVNTLKYAGNVGANNTNATLGGFEISNTAYLTAGSSGSQDGTSQQTNKNIYITVTPKTNFTDEGTTLIWLTDYADSNLTCSNPQLVEISKDRYLVLWEEHTAEKGNYIKYVFIDGKGELIGEVYEGNAQLSDCQPIYDGTNVVWYVTDGAELKFYTIHAENGDFKEKPEEMEPVVESISLNQNSLSLSVGETVQLTVSYQPEDAIIDRAVSWNSTDEKVAAVDAEGRVTARGAGTAEIQAVTDNGKRASCQVTVKKETDSETTPGDNTGDDIPSGDNTGDNTTSGDNTGDDIPSGDNTGDDTTSGDNTGDDTPSGDNTGDDTPSGDNTGDDTPSGDNTGDDTPSGDNTGDDTPSGDNTGDDTTSGDNTGDNTPSGDNTGDDIPSGDNTGDDTPSGDNTGNDTTSGDNTGDDTPSGDNTGDDTPSGDNTGDDTTSGDNTGDDTPSEDNTGDDTISGDNSSDNPAPEINPSDSVSTVVEKNWIFTDVLKQKGHWKYESVKHVYNRDIMGAITGTTLFQPDHQLTRAMFATVLYRMAGEPWVGYQSRFSDVEAGKWYTNAILWANEKGIVNGYSDGRYGINDNITREQIAKMLCLYGESAGYKVSGRASIDSFTDVANVSSWAVEYFQWAVDTEMISGKPNGDGSFRLDAKGQATRAECAKMLKMFMEKYNHKIPLSLSKVSLIASYKTENNTEAITDKKGNSYHHAVSYDTSWNAYAEYKLDGKFTKLSGRFFVSPAASSGKNITIAIYQDGKRVFLKEGITETSEPIQVELDVTNGQTLRIETKNKGTYDHGWLRFVDTSLR